MSLIRMIVLVAPVLLIAACHQEGPAEKAGKSLDKAGQNIHDAIDPPGPLEKAGRAIDGK